MGLLNYSTSVSVEKTLGEIQYILAKSGARSILVAYDGQANPTAVSFLVPTAFGDRLFRLPANLDAVWKILTQQRAKGELAPRFMSREQASRVGWRILKDWLEAQLALIETEMVSLEEVMLPYMSDHTGRTLYEYMIERRLQLPQEAMG